MVTDFTVPVTGGELAAARLGGGDGPQVVAVHGITANNRCWLAVTRALGGRATIVAPDLRGRAGSRALPPPYGLDAHADDVLAVLDALGLRRALLVGHSLGAYIVTRAAVRAPDRVRAVLLLDGGLTLPGLEHVDPQAFADALLGPAIARLSLRFASHEEYHRWWRAHPALAEPSDVADEDLAAYTDRDLIGSEPPDLRSSVLEPAVRADVADFQTAGEPARRLAIPAQLLCAPRGLLNDPNPLQPLALGNEWAAGDPAHRSVRLVPDVNHYQLVLGAAGAVAVADAIAAMV